MSDNRPVDPQELVVTDRREQAEAFGEWFVNASDDERQAFVDAHGDRVRTGVHRGEGPGHDTDAEGASS